MSGNFTLEWRGEAVQAVLEKAAHNGVKKALLDLGEYVQAEAPIDSGDLRGNYSVVIDEKVELIPKKGEPVPGESQQQAIVGVAGFSLPYARKQHEELKYKHTEGKAKYLENPFNARSKLMQNFVGEEVRKALK